jgi:hypothetical protein
VYFRIVDNFEATEATTVEEQIEQFEEDIGMCGAPVAETAMQLLRADMIARGIDPDAMPDVELDRAWFKEDDFGDDFAAYQQARQNAIEGKLSPEEEAGIEIEM